MDEVPVVSFSQLQAWDRCEFQWHIQYELDYVPVEKKRGLEIGSMGHEALADYYKCLRDKQVGNNPNPFSAKLWFTERFPEFTNKWMADADDSFDFSNLSIVTWLIMRYTEMCELMDDGHEIIAVEQHFELPMVTPRGREYRLQGYVDLVSRDVAKKLWLWDHKLTGQFWSPVEVMMDSQTPTYAAAWRDQGEDIFGIIINQLKNYDYKDKNKVRDEQIFKREQTYRTPKELDAIKFETGKMVDDLLERREHDGYPRRSLTRDCRMCSYQEPCLMGLKGIPVEFVLEDSFKKKGSREVAEATESVTEIEIDLGGL